MANGLMSVTFVNLAIGITTERDEGSLKRLAVTPMPKASYFIGKIGMVLVCAVAEIALLGIAASSVPRSAKSAAAVINLPFVALQFISGVFVPYSELSPAVRVPSGGVPNGPSRRT